MIICALCLATDINKMSACVRVGEWRRDGGGDCRRYVQQWRGREKLSCEVVYIEGFYFDVDILRN